MILVKILKDIQLRENGHLFTQKCAVIEYDSKSRRKDKTHLLIHQQGSEYGSIGDCCEYLSQQDLESLAARGLIRIDRLR